MQLLKLPISKNEAWRCFNQNQPVIMASSWDDNSSIIEPGTSYDQFKDNYFFSIPLSLEESKPFWQLYKQFAWTIAGAACTGPIGLILAALSFLNSHTIGFESRYQLYGIISLSLLCFCSFCIFLMIKQVKKETKLWSNLFEKYQVSDWKSSWR